MLYGPYEPSTVVAFEAMIRHVLAWLPDLTEEQGYVLASRPFVLGLAYVGDPVFEPLAGWLRAALLRGLDDQVRAGDPPAIGGGWRSKLRLAE